MSHDIEPFLHYWLQIADKMQVKRIRVQGKKVQIQIGIDNVIYYYLYTNGHPYGYHPNAYRSFLSYFQSKLKKQRSYNLILEDWMRLKQEAISYFSRGLAYYKLSEFHACAADAKHGLEVIRFVVTYCDEEENIHNFEKLYPLYYFLYYLALASMSLKKGSIDSALWYLKKGEQQIKKCYEKYMQYTKIEKGIEEIKIRRVRKKILDIQNQIVADLLELGKVRSFFKEWNKN